MLRGVEIYVIYIGPSFSRKSRLKMQNEDLRQNASSGHIILANWRDNKAITTYLEYLTIGAHMRTIFFCSKSSKGFLKLTSPSSSLSSSPSAMMNDTRHAIRERHWERDKRRDLGISVREGKRKKLAHLPQPPEVS